MGYKRSRARVDYFKTSLQLLSLARSVSYKRVNLSYDHKNLIYQAAIVLLCAAIEEYLKRFFEDLIFSYRRNGALVGHLPKQIRAFALLENQKPKYAKYLYFNDEKDVLEKLDPDNSFFQSIVDANAPLTNQITAESLTGKKKYPSIKNLKVLFNRIGIKNFVTKLNSAGGRDYGLDIDNFQSMRTTIAHHSAIQLTFEDVKEQFKRMDDLVNRIDRMCFGHICQESSIVYWIGIT